MAFLLLFMPLSPLSFPLSSKRSRSVSLCTTLDRVLIDRQRNPNSSKVNGIITKISYDIVVTIVMTRDVK